MITDCSRYGTLCSETLAAWLIPKGVWLVQSSAVPKLSTMPRYADPMSEQMLERSFRCSFSARATKTVRGATKQQIRGRSNNVDIINEAEVDRLTYFFGFWVFVTGCKASIYDKFIHSSNIQGAHIVSRHPAMRSCRHAITTLYNHSAWQRDHRLVSSTSSERRPTSQVINFLR